MLHSTPLNALTHSANGKVVFVGGCKKSKKYEKETKAPVWELKYVGTVEGIYLMDH